MKHTPRIQIGGLVASAALALVLAGCNGKDGANGQNGTNGTNGTNGANGKDAVIVLDASQMTTDQWAALKPKVTVTGVTMGSAPVVSFKITDSLGTSLKGLGAFTTKSIVPDRNGNLAVLPGYPNLAFALAKLVPEDATTKAPSKWVSYIVSSVPVTSGSTGAAIPAAPSRPTTDNTGTLVDNGDGTYKYTFYRDITAAKAFLDAQTYSGNNIKADLGDVSYQSSLVHRLTIQFSGAARGTGSNTPDGVSTTTAVNMENPVNVIYDFVPATGAAVAAGTDIRDVVAIGKCNECHDKLAFHGGGRVEARYCVVCHTDQRKYGYAEAAAGTTTTYTGSTHKINGGAAGDMTAMAHRIHMGKELTKTGYNYANVKFETLGYSMLDAGQRMCAKCHSGVAQADNWKNKPTRLACGTCHDQWNFATGHGGAGPSPLVPAQADDTACAICHKAADVTAYHMTNNLTTHNPAVPAGLTNFTYELSSASQATSGGDVTVKFRILGSTDGSTPAPVTFLAPAAGMANPLTGFTGSPSFQLAWTMAQDGVAVPADFNNLLADNGAPSASNFQPRSVSIAALLDTNKALTDGTLAGPDASGYYTATIVGANRIFPVGAKMRAVGLQGYFTQISTVDRNGDGLVNSSDNVARHAISVVKPVAGDAVRRVVIDNKKCANCHEWFEGHGGNRVYEVQICVQCHVPGLTTSGKGMTDAALSAYYPNFTAAQKTTLTGWTGVDFSVNPVTAGGTNVALAFPQTTNNMKDMIHGIHAGKDRNTPIKIVRDRTPSAINVINGAEIGFPGILNDCMSCHTTTGFSTIPSAGLFTREEAVNPAGNTTTALAKSALAASNGTDLMISPFTAACVTCHDSAPAKAHMVTNGGQIKVLRSALAPNAESCAVCHGAGSEFDPVKVHK